MAKLKQKGKSGAAKNYITRNQALKKLQCSLSDFRRLCILKGIFPREPRHKKRANKGSSAPATFYYAKDITYLLHEPVLQRLRDHKAFAKKLSRALGRGEWSLAKSLEENKPVYRLDHIIKERYPIFVDSLRDLDDALSLISLFANLPSNQRIPPSVIAHCARVTAEWQLYVMRTRSLRKVFLSIKGIYFQAEVMGQTITWLVPYLFTQHIPADVDFRIMLTFLELYQTLLGFVLFKLYNDINLVYPPKLDEGKDDAAAGVGALILQETGQGLAKDQRGENGTQAPATAMENGEAEEQEKDKKKKLSAKDVKRAVKQISAQTTASVGLKEEKEATQAGATGMEDDEDATIGADFVAQPSKSSPFDTDESAATLSAIQASTASLKSLQNLFSDYIFYLSREVPRPVFEFIIRAFGGQVGWDSTSLGAGSPYEENDERITHHVSDRPVPTEGPNAEGKGLYDHPGKRSYIQPQWVVDCINARKLLPTEPYRPGKSLPPHLSPFVDIKEVERRGGYVPDAAKVGIEGRMEDGEMEEEDESSSEEEEEQEDVAGDADEEEAEDGEGRAAPEGQDKAKGSARAAVPPALAAALASPLDASLLHAAELEAEASGASIDDVHAQVSQAAKKARKMAKQKKNAAEVAGVRATEEEDEEMMRRAMMSNKARKLHQRAQAGMEETKKEAARLEAKKKANAKAAKKAVKTKAKPSAA